MNQKLTHIGRLTRKEEFDRVFTNGKRLVQNRITACLAPSSEPRLGCAVSSRYGTPVQRNRFKRRVRAVFRQNYHQLPAADLVISARPGSGEIGYPEIENFFSQIILHGSYGD